MDYMSTMTRVRAIFRGSEAPKARSTTSWKCSDDFDHQASQGHYTRKVIHAGVAQKKNELLRVGHAKIDCSSAIAFIGMHCHKTYHQYAAEVHHP